ncbi:MAG: ferrous iron transport protein B [Rickettsiales bacterium]|jgi:ferrous iron transport protein B|nr:ferrous iron transport protein B [Rickettsiales bacterium]
MTKTDHIIALVGNPNSGKTSIFNALAGQNQRVGNWAGVTVDSRSGTILENEDVRLTLVDLPGLYSLRTKSEDEAVASRFILGNYLSMVIVVLDASRLERSLYLYSQIKELGSRVLVILNMNDVALSEGVFIGSEKLSKKIGCPVVKTLANRTMDVASIKNTILKALDEKQTGAADYFREILNETIRKVKTNLSEAEVSEILRNNLASSQRSYGNVRFEEGQRTRDIENLKNAISIKLLEKESRWDKHLSGVEKIKKLVGETGDSAELEPELDLQTMLIEDRWNFVHSIATGVTRKIAESESISEKIDKVLLNRFVGVPIFLLVMFIIFSLVFRLSKPIVALTEYSLKWAAEYLRTFLLARKAHPLLISLLVNGIVSGAGTVVAFFPNIFLLFTFLGFLEDSGYFSRGTFLMDRIMASIGLEGKSFIPMLMGFGCSVPAMMGTRILDRKRDRILTMLVIPFMSCSAKLPIFALFSSVFFPNNSAAIVLLLYVIGLIMAAVAAKILSKTILRNRYSSSLFVELPPYHRPILRNVLKYGFRNAMEFLRSAGTYIMAGILVVWLFSSLPLGVEYASEHSLLGILGTKLTFLFKYTGYGFWQAVVAIIFGLMAKEVVASSLAAILSVSGDGLAVALRNYFSPLSAFSFLITVLLYPPCLSATLVFKRETKSWGWTFFMLGYTFVLAVTVSTIFYQLGKFLNF